MKPTRQMEQDVNRHRICSTHRTLLRKDSAYRSFIYGGMDSFCHILNTSYSKIYELGKDAFYRRFEKANKKARAKILTKINRQRGNLMVRLVQFKSYVLGRTVTPAINMSDKKLPKNHPFLKWAGGKLKLTETIKKFFPPIGGTFFEPFAGAASVSLNTDSLKIHINDVNPDLILTWKVVRDNPEELITECRSLFTPKFNTRESYLELREEFNKGAGGIRRAALFIYLNRHGFNGMCRYSSKGRFNIPFGNYKVVGLPHDRIREVSSIIKNWGITCCDFKDVIGKASAGDVVYCDPPYVPEKKVKKGTGFTSYAKEGFSQKDQISLADAAKDAVGRGATVIISNHATEFTEKIYAERGAKLVFIKVRRSIAAKAESRTMASELIALFAP